MMTIFPGIPVSRIISSVIEISTTFHERFFVTILLIIAAHRENVSFENIFIHEKILIKEKHSESVNTNISARK